METPSELQLHPEPPKLQTSSSLLRFPKSAVDGRISSWVESVSAANMSTRSEAQSDDSILGESTYEFIDTDEESRDENATESVASTDFGRPDDIASLADTEQSDEESGDEDHQGTASVPVLPHHDHAVEQAFNTPTIGRSSAVLLEDLDKPLTQSIEFEEPFSLGAETVSVKHTVADFNEEQTTNTVKGMVLQSPPQRLVITIRQTMTKQGLSTRDPLRILYVGSHSAKQDIIHKLASSVTASVESGKRAHHLRHSTSQLYNVVPVSAFGSERTPEIELMHSSGYQIKVEDCILAENLKFEDVPEKPDVIKLTLDGNFAYHSVPEGQGFIVEPHWELPHVAIFYCSDSDDIEARRTRTIARKFMSRHSIPSIVISHKQLFDRGQCMSLDQHSIHMCLESRDPNGSRNIIHQRLPIDLASFLNIDARQMNRNLAYLTGLHEPLDSPAPPMAAKKVESGLVNPQDVEKTSYSISDSVNFIRNRNGGAVWRAVLPVGVLLLSVLFAVLTGIPSYRFYRVSTAPAISVNSKIMSAVSISSTASLTLAPPVPSVNSTPTSIAVKTSTRTITVTESQASGPNSLSVLPSTEIGKLSQAVQNLAKSVNKTSLCAAEVLGDREILIRIPSATKLSWLAKEAMSVNVTRDNVTVETERAYSSDEGIVLLLPKKEAYGILNISIVTTKKPRVNETFQVDFGTTASQTWHSLVNKLSSFLPEDANVLDPHLFGHMLEAAENMAEEARVHSQSTLSRMEEIRKVAIEQAASASTSLTELAKSISLEAAKRSAIISKELGIQLSEAEAQISKRMKSLQHLREPLDEGLMKAQVRSKLVWLKIQGKEEEYRDYKRRAAEATRSRTEDSRKCRKTSAQEKKKENRAAKKAAKKEARATRKAAKNARI
jgi:hypothetical protein